MIDLSEEPIEENIDTCVEYLKRMAPLGMYLEIELGVTGARKTVWTTPTLTPLTCTRSLKKWPMLSKSSGL